MRALAALAALLVLLLPTAARALDEELLGALKRVQEVRIDGNRSIKDGAIKKVIKTGAGSFLGLRSPPLFRPDFLKADVVTIQNLYIRHGFLEANVAARADSGDKASRVIVVFTVAESLQVRVRSIEFDTSYVADRGAMHRATKLRVGEAYDPVQLALDREAIAQLFAEEGYFPSITTLVSRDSLWVDIRVGIKTGPRYRVRDIRIAGVAEVDTNVVRREIQFDPGDPFRRERVIKSTERLYGTTLFNSAEVVPTLADTTTGLLDLDARVRERKERYLQGGVGFSNIEIIRLSGEWGHRNLAGTGRAVSVGASFGYFDPVKWNAHAQVSYVEPWLLGLRLRGQLTPLWDRSYYTLGANTYVEEGPQILTALIYDYPYSKSQISLTLENSWPRIENVDSSIVTHPNVRRWTVAYSQDVRDDRLDPRSGSLSRYAVQLANAKSGGQGNYLHFEVMNGMHLPRGSGGALSARVRAGLLAPVGPGPAGEDVLARVEQTDRLYIGGVSSLRGYHENGVDDNGNGGRLMLNLNLELRIPLKGVLSTAAFLDGGNVWRHLADVKLERMVTPQGVDGTYGAADMRYAIGAGIRVRTPIGPMRLDYGWRLHPDESDLLANRKLERSLVHFGIGQMF